MRKLIPILLIILGVGAGAGAGLTLRPEEEAAHLDNPCGEPVFEPAAQPDHEKADDAAAYVKLNNQFVVPVVTEGRISSLVVMALSLEVGEGNQDQVFRHEPKLRDAFLQVLFDHANLGGFDGAFTTAGNMVTLRQALGEAAKKVLGDVVKDVLIVDVVRQDA